MRNIDENKIIQEDLDLIVSNKFPWKSLANKSFLITGGAGFLGAYLIKTLLKANQLYKLGIDIICVSRNLASIDSRLKFSENFSELTFFEQDMSMPLRHDFPSADIIIHAASQASPTYYSKDPVGTLGSNLLGTYNLLNFLKDHKIHKFLFISSGEVYGEQIDINMQISENSFGYLDPIKIRSCYGESKKMAENICVSFSHQYDIDAEIIRLFHTYGPGLSPKDGRVFADFIHSAASGKDINMTSSGNSKRPFCYISDAITGILHVIFFGEIRGAYNLANPSAEVSIKALAEVISSIRGDLKINIKKINRIDSYIESPISRQVVNIDKLKSLGWYPRVNVIDGFSRSVLSEIEALASN